MNNLETAIDKLAESWRECGISQGDVVLIHSNLSRTVRRQKKLGINIKPEDILKSFFKAVGSEGTLILPLFNFDFTKGTPFDIRLTPSQMGVLTEIAREWDGAVRTGHPVYSFAAIGSRSSDFDGVVNFCAYGADSPFSILKTLKGKIAVLDLPDQHSMTFYHHVEEMEKVPYRFHKVFKGQYTDFDGNTSNKEFSIYVRNLEQGVKTHVEPMGELLWEKGLYEGYRPKEGCGLRVISTPLLFDTVKEIIRTGKAEGMLYRTKDSDT